MATDLVTGSVGAGLESHPAAAPSALRTAPAAAVTPPQAPAPAAQAAVDHAALKKSVDALNNFIQPHLGNIEFSLDPDSGKELLKVVDKDTNTVLLQIPSKQALALAQDLGNLKGFLIKDSA